jgi:hypothetical protein
VQTESPSLVVNRAPIAVGAISTAAANQRDASSALTTLQEA